jgi:predicted TIM-barrel fold metal-dependent hydrolase|tara:strand:+ start:21242 stop:22255 length:1014 start_codon:yes stop_codon:yes gene_type:complete
MNNPTPGTPDWLAQVEEEIIDPKRPIVDPHHHLWQRPGGSYVLEDLWGDTESGHNIEKTVFVECHANYRTDGPEHMQPIGETEFVAAVAAESAEGGAGRARIAAIVSHADLTLGEEVAEVLNAHQEAGQGHFRGIRHSGARDEKAQDALMIPGRAPEGLYEREDFRQGVRLLGQLGLTYDTWHYHHQNPSFADLAQAAPETTMILDHFGTPLGVGPYQGKRDEIFDQWKKDIATIARSENVVAKLGGLAMPDNGFGWHSRATPATSDELVEAQQRYYLHTIECFGPERCMFESNFPVDKFSISYAILWNALKKMVADLSEAEKDELFRGTASRVYGI